MATDTTSELPAAEEVAPHGRWTILALSGAVLACGLLPGVVLALAGPALRLQCCEGKAVFVNSWKSPVVVDLSIIIGAPR